MGLNGDCPYIFQAAVVWQTCECVYMTYLKPEQLVRRRDISMEHTRSTSTQNVVCMHVPFFHTAVIIINVCFVQTDLHNLLRMVHCKI
jgi:hypothetical protein